MMNFPNNTNEMFDEKEQICHSLIEDSLFANYSSEYIISMINKLKEYKEKNGEDMIIDTLFMKYLNKVRIKIINSFRLLKNNESNYSQYHIAVAYFSNEINATEMKKDIFEQAWKLCTNDKIIYKGIEISKVIMFYLMKNENIWNKDMILNSKYINNNLKDKIIENKVDLMPYSKDILWNKKKYKERMSNLDQFYSISYWTSVVINEAIDNNTIDVKDNPYLFNAAACLCYSNPMIRVNLDISNFKFPEKITLDLMKVIRYQISLKDLLEYKTISIEVKNLCTFVYLLILDQVSIKDLEKYKNSMSFNSYMILLLVYMNYANIFLTQEMILSIVDQINIKDSNGFLCFRLLNDIIKNKIIDFERNDLLYIVSRQFNTNKITNETYAIFKKKLMKNSYDQINKQINFFDIYKEDFVKFLKNAIKFTKGQKKINLINYYNQFETDKKINIELIFAMIDERAYNDACDSLKKLDATQEIIDILTDEVHIPNISFLLGKISRNTAIELINKFKLKDKINSSVKFNIFFNLSLSYFRIEIDRKQILNDSIEIFKKNNLKNKYIKVNYKLEGGQDEGGLSRDWFTSVSNEIRKVNAFIPVPNGDKLIFNNKCNNNNIYEFTGKLLALAITNKRNIDIKLTSFIMKKITGEKITIDDMKDYDEELYQSLKWISENDPEPLMMTFVDSNDEELCENGKNIDLTKENKERFIDLMIEKKLIEPNSSSLNLLVNGFHSVLNATEINILNSKDIYELVNGVDYIDIEDWKRNTRYNNEKMYNNFFIIISKWSQENLKKLLKFVTGSSNVPIGGFNYFDMIGGKFRLEFSSYDSEKLPEAHTCFNKVNIPMYNTIEKFEKKLLLTLECDSFAFA